MILFHYDWLIAPATLGYAYVAGLTANHAYDSEGWNFSDRPLARSVGWIWPVVWAFVIPYCGIAYLLKTPYALGKEHSDKLLTVIHNRKYGRERGY